MSNFCSHNAKFIWKIAFCVIILGKSKSKDYDKPSCLR